MKYFSPIYTLQIFAAYFLFSLASAARISQSVITPSSSYQSSFSGIPNYEHQQPIGPFFGYFPNLLSPCSPCPSCPATPVCPNAPSTCPETPTSTATTPTTSTATTPTTSTATTPTTSITTTTTTTTAPTTTTTSEPTTTTTTAPPPTCPTCPSCMSCPATTIPTTTEPTTTTTTAAPPTCPTCPSCMTCPATTTPTTCPPVTSTTAAPLTCRTCPTCIVCPQPPPPEIITTCDNGLNSSVSGAPNGTISVDIPDPDVSINCVYGFVAFPPNNKIVVRCNSLSAGARFWFSKAIPVTAGVVGIDYTSKTSHLIMTANNLLNKIGIKLDCTWRAIP